MSPNEQIAHSLKIKFGTGPGEPNSEQLAKIIAEILTIQAAGSKVSDKVWRDAVHKHCPSAGHYKYAGIDNSDLNTLLALAVQATNKKG